MFFNNYLSDKKLIVPENSISMTASVNVNAKTYLHIIIILNSFIRSDASISIFHKTHFLCNF